MQRRNNQRPVTPGDIRKTEQRLAVKRADVQTILGILPTDFHLIRVGKKVFPSTVALSMILLNEYGETVSPLRRCPTLREFREFVCDIDPTWAEERVRFATLFGKERTAINRWAKREDSPGVMPMTSRRAMQIIWLTLQTTPLADRKRMLDWIYQRNIEEFILRGYDRDMLVNHHRFVLASKVEEVKAEEKNRRKKAREDAAKKKRTGAAPAQRSRKPATQAAL